MSDRPERRKTIRFRATAPIAVQSLDARVPLTLVDLSGGGFSARCETELAIGVVMRFTFSSHDGSWTTLLSAQSVYIRPGTGDEETEHGFLIGFKFMNPEIPRVAASINALIDRATAVASFS